MTRNLRLVGNMVAMVALAATPCWAVDTTVTYSSGILVIAFLGVLALIVVAQLVPALVLMIGFFKAVATAMTRRKAVVEATKTN